MQIISGNLTKNQGIQRSWKPQRSAQALFLLKAAYWESGSERAAVRGWHRGWHLLSMSLTMGMQGGRSVPWIPMAVQPSEREMWIPFT